MPCRSRATAFDGRFVRAVDFVEQMNFNTAQWVDYLADALGPLQLTPQTRQTLIDYVNAAGEFQENGVAQPNSPVQNIADVQPVPQRGFRRVQRPQGGRYGRGNAGGGPNRPGFGGLEGRLRGVIPLMMATPEYQVC